MRIWPSLVQRLRRARAIASGFRAHFGKPLDLDKLAAALAEMVGASSGV